MFHDCSKAIIANPLAVHAGHGVPRVSHDGVHCDLIAQLAADRFERVTKGIERMAVTNKSELAE